MNRRPRLRSHVQPLRRGPGSLQLGLSADAGVVLDGLSEAEIALVEGLDGSKDLQMLYAGAVASGVAPSRLSDLMAALDERHLLVDTVTDRAALSPIDDEGRHRLRPDASALAAAYGLAGDGYDRVAARAAQHVLISAEGNLPRALADLLRIGGIGRVSVGAEAVNRLDLDLRGEASVPSDTRPDGPPLPNVPHLPKPSTSPHLPKPSTSPHAPRPSNSTHLPTASNSPQLPDLVVLAALGAVRPDAGAPWLRRGIPHLPLVVQGHRVHVGPLIGAGGRPCLSCLDLHRSDRDGAWPALLSQLAPPGPFLLGAPISLESTLTAMTVGVVAMIVNTCLDGHPVPGDLSLELSLPWPAIQSRRWFPHPLCRCLTGHATMAG